MQKAQPKRVNKKVAKAQKTAKRAASTKKGMKKSSAFAPTTTARRLQPAWAKAKSPFKKDLPAEFVTLQAELDGMWREVYAAPKDVKPIDFAYFEGKIKNKAAFAQIKKDHDAVSFPVTKTPYQSKEAAAAKVKAAEGQAEFMKDTIVTYNTRIQQLKFASTVIPFLSLQEEISLVPGLDQEFDRQLSNYQQVPDEVVMKALDIDSKKMRDQLAAGVFPELPAEGIKKIMYTPVYFAAMQQHDQYRADVLEKYKVKIPSASTIISRSLKRQGQLPSLEQISQHLDEFELPFALSAIKSDAKPVNPFAM